MASSASFPCVAAGYCPQVDITAESTKSRMVVLRRRSHQREVDIELVYSVTSRLCVPHTASASAQFDLAGRENTSSASTVTRDSSDANDTGHLESEEGSETRRVGDVANAPPPSPPAPPPPPPQPILLTSCVRARPCVCQT
jgi:hypothetical protein